LLIKFIFSILIILIQISHIYDRTAIQNQENSPVATPEETPMTHVQICWG